MDSFKSDFLTAYNQGGHLIQLGSCFRKELVNTDFFWQKGVGGFPDQMDLALGKNNNMENETKINSKKNSIVCM